MTRWKDDPLAYQRERYAERKDAITARRREQYDARKNTDKARLRRTGVTRLEYERMARDQQYRCAICHEEESGERLGRVLELAVDHDHTTKVVRGLLCRRCNLILGKVGDQTALLQRMIDYLEEHADVQGEL